MADARQNGDSSSVPSSPARASRESTVCMTPPPQQPKLSEEEIAAAVAVVVRAGDLQKKVDKLEDNLQRACRVARTAELRAEAAEEKLDSKVGVKESLDEEKARSAELEAKLEEEKRRVSALTRQNCILSKDLTARDDRIKDLTSKLAKSVDELQKVRMSVKLTARPREDSEGEDEQRLKRSKTDESDGEDEEDEEKSSSDRDDNPDRDEEPSGKRSSEESSGENAERSISSPRSMKRRVGSEVRKRFGVFSTANTRDVRIKNLLLRTKMLVARRRLTRPFDNQTV